MPKKWLKYEQKPHEMSPEIRRRFEALMEKKEEPLIEQKGESQVPTPKGELWRWDTLEDCPEYNI